MNEREVTRIHNPVVQPDGERQKKRVFCYLRVSTEVQSSSMESQMEGFNQKIAASSDWQLAGVYADEGLSGTRAKKRPQFLKMIEDAKAGGCDIILCKSLSRYARNTVDALTYVRMLKEYGVACVFLKEGLNTANETSEMILTVLAAFSQEESFSISENLKWGIRKRYEMGELRWTQLYGYRNVGEDKELKIVIHEAEAQVVRMLFSLYRKGVALPSIVDQLNTAGVPAPRGGKWTATTIQGILKNERYVGDTMLQKYISLDHISHKCVRNDATEVPSYYVRNSHVPVVDRRTFDQVQRIMELKAPRGECSRYPYEDTKAVCPFCGEKLVTRLVHCSGSRKVLGCFGEHGCHKFAVKTWMVDAVLLSAFEEIDEVTGAGDGSKRMKEMKAAGTPETVEYYFLADAVKSITFTGTEVTRIQNHKKGEPTEEQTYSWEMTVNWQSGDSTTLRLPESRAEEPVHVAELYERYLGRLESGEYVPARPTCLRERKAAEGRTVRAVKAATSATEQPGDGKKGAGA